MKEYQSLSHTRWDCKYHVVFIPKRRKKRIFGELRSPSRGDVPRPGRAQGIEDCGRASDGQSRAYVYQHPPEVCGGQCGGVSQGQECDTDCA